MLLYVLRLKEKKYYVGVTNNLTSRIKAHTLGKGSAWTKKYPPSSLAYTKRIFDPLQEDLEVKNLMRNHGCENVRGGTYSQITLDATQLQTLQQELAHAKGACTRCGADSHWVKDCFARTHVNGHVLGPQKRDGDGLHHARVKRRKKYHRDRDHDDDEDDCESSDDDRDHDDDEDNGGSSDDGSEEYYSDCSE